MTKLSKEEQDSLELCFNCKHFMWVEGGLKGGYCYRHPPGLYVNGQDVNPTDYCGDFEFKDEE